MKKLLFMAVIGSLATAQAGLAEDLQPPWWRGEWSTTSQVWEFGDELIQPGVAVPPDGPAPGGQPPLSSTELIWEPGLPPWDVWLEQDKPYEYEPGTWVGLGVVPLSGWIDVTVDNHEPPNLEKRVRVQITWRPQDVGERPILEGLDPPPAVPPMLVQEIPLGPDWRESTYDWIIRPNPEWEKFTISGTINVDELVIDTWCIPEPATLCVLACGGVLALRRRKR